MNPISEELIAPCGINCAICSRYLAYKNSLRRSQCIGCRPGNKQCTYLFGKCPKSNNVATSERIFCYECEHYPCKHLNRADARYRENYLVSIKENLENIRQFGIRQFIEQEYDKHHCSRCGGLISIHNRKCFSCDKVTRLVEKHNREYGKD
jgi:hypothetical protein